MSTHNITMIAWSIVCAFLFLMALLISWVFSVDLYMTWLGVMVSSTYFGVMHGHVEQRKEWEKRP